MDGNEVEDNDRVDQPSKRQLNQGLLLHPLLSFTLFLIFLIVIIIIIYVLWKKKKQQKDQAKVRRKAMIKLPMLLSKPKKSYKSVSKTELIPESRKSSYTHQENHEDIDSFSIYEEIQNINEQVPENCIGKLIANIKYDYENCFLIVTIEKFTDFTHVAAATVSNEADEVIEEEERNVSIKIDMIPDKEHASETKTVSTKSEQADIYQEIIFKNIHFNRFQILSLHFKVVIDDTVFGEVTQEVAKINKNESFTDPVTLDLNVVPVIIEQQSGQSAGELLMSLCHQPAARRLSVVILKARNVPKMDITGFSDPYVKLYLHHQNTRSAKKKTHIKKRSLNPVFNESFIFDLPSKDGSLDEVQLEVIMCDWDRITKNEVIGRLMLGGPDCDGMSDSHWQEIQKSPRRPIAQWHKLSAP